MTERPILFSGEMVRAVLDGRKTQTRRVIKLQTGDTFDERALAGAIQEWRPALDGTRVAALVRCPYGVPGDHLWVRERQEVTNIMRNEDGRPIAVQVRYRADDCESAFIGYPERLKGDPVVGKCLSYGGYRESSRIHLEVTSVRVERVQDISNEDCLAEGVSPCIHEPAFADLWDSINAKRGYGWEVNPWVWVVEFKRWTS
jgi:hypothetical protein